MTFQALARQYPPILCRLLARKGRGHATIVLSTKEIAQKMRVDEFVVDSLSTNKSWATVPFGLMQQFLQACGIDFCDWKKVKLLNAFYARQACENPWPHLRRSREWLSYYEPMLKYFAASLK